MGKKIVNPSHIYVTKLTAPVIVVAYMRRRKRRKKILCLGGVWWYIENIKEKPSIASRTQSAYCVNNTHPRPPLYAISSYEYGGACSYYSFSIYIDIRLYEVYISGGLGGWCLGCIQKIQWMQNMHYVVWGSGVLNT